MRKKPFTIPQDKADSVLAWISSGKTLADWARIPGNPCRETVNEWQHKSPDFAHRFAHARDLGADAIAEEALAIIDEHPKCTVTDDKGRERTWTDGAGVARNKARFDGRLKLLAKWNPKKYGEVVQMQHSGEGGGPVKAEVKVEFVRTGDQTK